MPVSQDCVRELFLRLNPSVSAREAKHIKFWRFKTCKIPLRVPVSNMVEVRPPPPRARARRNRARRQPPSQPSLDRRRSPARMRSAPAL